MRKFEGKQVHAEGSGGANYIDLEVPLDNLENVVRLEISHSCVKTIRAYVPVEFITGMLTEAVLEHGGLREAIMALDWDEDIKEKLAAQVVELDSFNQPLPYDYLFCLDADGIAHLVVSQWPQRHIVVCTRAQTTIGDVSQGTRADIANSWALCEECWKGVE